MAVEKQKFRTFSFRTYYILKGLDEFAQRLIAVSRFSSSRLSREIAYVGRKGIWSDKTEVESNRPINRLSPWS